MNDKNDLFTQEEQLEIINIVKGIFVYASKNRQILSSEQLFLELLENSCNKVMTVIKEKNRIDN